MIEDVGGCFFNVIEKAAKRSVAAPVILGDENQLIERLYTLLFRVKCLTGFTFNVHLVEFEVSKGSNNRANLAGNQRR